MSLTSLDQSVPPTAPRGYRRAQPTPGRHLLSAPRLALTAGRLQVQVTLGGDTYAQRHQAKAAGYRWASGQWHHLLSVAIRHENPASRARGQIRLDALVTADTAPFTLWSMGDMAYLPTLLPLPGAVPEIHRPVVPTATPITSRLPIRLLTSLDALVATLGHGPLVVVETPLPRSTPSVRRAARTGWCGAVAELHIGMRYQVRAKVLLAAHSDARIQVDPVWRSSEAEGRWCLMYPMTSRWLQAETANQLILGQRLTMVG